MAFRNKAQCAINGCSLDKRCNAVCESEHAALCGYLSQTSTDPSEYIRVFLIQSFSMIIVVTHNAAIKRALFARPGPRIFVADFMVLLCAWLIRFILIPDSYRQVAH